MPQDSFLARLAAVVGRAQVLAQPQDTAPYFTDWRRQYHAAAECVVRPSSTAEVSAVVRLCADEGVALVPQGGNTGLCGGSVPTGARREIVLSLGRMNRIRELDALNNTLTAEAGCVLAEIQRAAEGAGRLFALSLGAQGSCMIGGNLSTNAGGVNVLRYGNAREQVLGLEVVLPDGRIWSGLRGLRKDNTGYDLKQLFIGAEGTLGVITAAVLKLYPRPSAVTTAWIALASPARAVELLARLRGRLGDRLSAFELVSRACLDAVLAHAPGTLDPLRAPHPWYVLAELADGGEPAALQALAEQALNECAEHGALEDVALAHSEAQARALWRIRDMIPEAQFRNVKHDVSVPVSRVPALIERASAALEAELPGVRVYAFGHIGDGNVHFNVGMGNAAATEDLIGRQGAVNRVVYGVVDALGGSISAEHGLGQLKREEIRRHKDPLELALMRTLKDALDPLGLMNPGKLL
ncbi:MAG TPA: FAD-binding oxidoreductase [Burkholderiales bacterium]|nr:FAD-binding oxidoreductase [Burkholderiales bacterium]